MMGNGQILARAIAGSIGIVLLIHPIQPRSFFGKAGETEGKESRGNLVFQCFLFVLFTTLFCLIKLRRFVFGQDVLLCVGLFTGYLFASRRIDILNAVYMSCVGFLCLDFCVALLLSHFVSALHMEAPWQKVLLEVLHGFLVLLLCRLTRQVVLTGRVSRMRMRDFLLLMLSFLPYLAIRAGNLMYVGDRQTDPAVEILLFLTMAATFGTLVGNRNAILAEAEKNRRLRLEMDMQEREKQYLIRKETMEEVRRKYHDMVKYARLFDERQEKQEDFAEFLEKRMTNDLDVDSMGQTGRPVLDMILWERLEECRKKNLRLLPMINGEALSFVEDFDLHTMIGNALDNAIEAAQKVEEENKRDIRLRITRRGGMDFVSVSNDYAGTLLTENHRLMTTKSGEGDHGYGLENIRLTAERYGGSVAYETEDNHFVLTILLPVP
ncbi:MAG: GHKL domain-containing protein [Lachnospiraceae bacterium]|nr:GHKL domain-containing protein [Lachnospiraceae bacterium]